MLLMDGGEGAASPWMSWEMDLTHRVWNHTEMPANETWHQVYYNLVGTGTIDLLKLPVKIPFPSKAPLGLASLSSICFITNAEKFSCTWDCAGTTEDKCTSGKIFDCSSFELLTARKVLQIVLLFFQIMLWRPHQSSPTPLHLKYIYLFPVNFTQITGKLPGELL